VFSFEFSVVGSRFDAAAIAFRSVLKTENLKL